MKKENERKLSIFLFHMLKIQYFLSPYLQRKKTLNKNKTRKKPFSNHEGSIRVPESTWKKRKKKVLVLLYVALKEKIHKLNLVLICCILTLNIFCESFL